MQQTGIDCTTKSTVVIKLDFSQLFSLPNEAGNLLFRNSKSEFVTLWQLPRVAVTIFGRYTECMSLV